MHTLVGWDSSDEAETINLLLNVDADHQAVVLTNGADFRRVFDGRSWDAVVMCLGFPTVDESYELFQSLRATHPDMPIIGVWDQGEITQLAKFISDGLHAYLMRDDEGQFIFLLTPMLEAAAQAAAANRARLLSERLREEVDSVRRLQESVIPSNLPIPEGYDIDARYEAAQIRIVGETPVTMAGGDYYDIFPLDEHRMILLVGDASGHGVKACMSIMTMHTLIRMIGQQQYPSAVEFINEVNRRLSNSDIVADEGGFITMLYCMLDLKEHKVHWCSAGHPMPLLQNLETNEVTVMADVEDGGLPLAIDEDWEYTSCSGDLPPNCRMLIYTDGLDEAFPVDGDDSEAFGLDGIINTLKETSDLPVTDVVDRLFADSQAATRGIGRMDDTSVVLLERKAV